jgi:hypothetical protein
MATYGYSAGYQGGGPSAVPSGYIEAYAQAGRNIGQGVQAIGNAIGESLQRYGQNKAENEFLTSRLESLAPYLQTVAQSGNIMDKNTPESKLLGDIEKFSSMSIPQKKATLLNAEFFLDRADKQRARELSDEATRQQLQLGALQLEDILDKRKQQNVLMEGIKYFSGQPQTETVTEQTQVPISVQYQPEGPFAVPAQSAPAIRPEQFYSEQIPAFRPMQQPQFMRPQGLPSTQPTPSIPQTWESVLGAEFANRLGTPVQPERTTPTTVENQALTTFETTKQVPITTEQKIPYEQQSRKLTDFLIQQGAKPETIAMVPQIMSMISGQQKPIQVDTQTLPGGITVVRADGKVDILPAPKMVDGKQLTEAQSKAASFAAGMKLNNETINSVFKSGYSPRSLTEVGFMPERLKTDSRKSYEAARDAWIENFLRDRSGAVISPDEYPAAEKQYFPIAGDSEKVVKQKELMRIDAMNNTMKKAGQNADDYMNQISSGQARSPLLSDPRVAVIRARQASGAITKQQAIQQIESLK